MGPPRWQCWQELTRIRSTAAIASMSLSWTACDCQPEPKLIFPKHGQPIACGPWSPAPCTVSLRSRTGNSSGNVAIKRVASGAMTNPVFRWAQLLGFPDVHSGLNLDCDDCARKRVCMPSLHSRRHEFHVHPYCRPLIHHKLPNQHANCENVVVELHGTNQTPLVQTMFCNVN